MDLSNRITKLNDAPVNTKGRYVLYWMQMFKRASHNYALNFAIKVANERNLPLVVYEGLTFEYPWANDRIHTFVLQGVLRRKRRLMNREFVTSSICSVPRGILSILLPVWRKSLLFS